MTNPLPPQPISDEMLREIRAVAELSIQGAMVPVRHVQRAVAHIDAQSAEIARLREALNGLLHVCLATPMPSAMTTLDAVRAARDALTEIAK